MSLTVAIIGEYQQGRSSHTATDEALEHAARAIGTDIQSCWISTGLLSEPGGLRRIEDALFIAPGSPYKSIEGALSAIRWAREQGRPLLGTCGGFQHLVLEYARNVLGITDARHAEYDPYASNLFPSLSVHWRAAAYRLRFDPIPWSLGSTDARMSRSSIIATLA